MTITRWDAVAALGAVVVMVGLYFIAWPLPVVAAGAALCALGVHKA